MAGTVPNLDGGLPRNGLAVAGRGGNYGWAQGAVGYAAVDTAHKPVPTKRRMIRHGRGGNGSYRDWLGGHRRLGWVKAECAENESECAGDKCGKHFTHMLKITNKMCL